MDGFPQVPDPAGGPGVLDVRSDIVKRDWEDACGRLPAQMADCFRALVDEPFPPMWIDEFHGPVRGAAATTGPRTRSWAWRLSDVETVRYVRGPFGDPLVTRIGAPE